MIHGDANEERNVSLQGSADDLCPTNDESDHLESTYLEPHIQEQLGRVLRTFCDDLINQPIPDKFVVLLAKLEAKQRERK
jgi:hypothetical protein